MNTPIKSFLILLFVAFSAAAIVFGYVSTRTDTAPSQGVLTSTAEDAYWFVLHRKSNREDFYRGIPGDVSNSNLVKIFIVKTGIPGERPTPLPQLVGREYWLIVDKTESFDNPETAPYFLQFDVDAPPEWPYGPMPYEECNGPASTRGVQCDWVTPGYFGMHGTGGDPSKLSKDDPGSSGCVRHNDEDIAYLYTLLDPENEEIRYYIEDN